MRMRLIPILGPLMLAAAVVADARAAAAPDENEVQALVARALEKLSRLVTENLEDRLGAKCLAAMAYLKTGAPPGHPVVQKALQACRESANKPFPIEDVYSNGLAVILLCEVEPAVHRELIERYLASLYARQKPHGGWGYTERLTGDTSQTQYAVLGMWSAHRAGIRVQSEPIVRALGWLMRTQDPSGVWGYQGVDSEGAGRVPQTSTSISMLAAGLGSTLMAAQMLGIAETAEDAAAEELDLPPAVTRADDKPAPEPLAGADRIDRERLMETIRLAGDWMERNFTIESNSYNYYYLYALERYKSFEELVAGEPEPTPDWYVQGFELLRERQAADGGWIHGCGTMPDTAFGVLFLVRSTRKTLQSGGIGDGLLVGGRGLPQNVATATVQRGRLIADETAKSVDELVQILEDPDHPQFEDLLADPRGLLPSEIGPVTASDVPRLYRLIRGGEPNARLVSVQALVKRDHLDDAPTLIFAMTDPDRRVVLAARDALRLVSRRREGFGLPDAFTDSQRFDAIEAWKAWYLSVRPGEVIDE